LKNTKNTGSSVLTFNSRISVDRYHTMVFNMGNLYMKYGNDPRFFRSINMDDPDFQQREIMVGMDGSVIPEFDKLINNVTVTLRKSHELGELTIKEIKLTKTDLNEIITHKIINGIDGDKDRVN